MNELILIIGMALVTFAVRYPVLAILGRLNLPEVVRRGLRYVPPAVLSAIVVPAAVMPSGTLELAPQNAYLVAGILSGVIAWYTKKLLPTIVIGMVIFLVWRTIFPPV